MRLITLFTFIAATAVLIPLRAAASPADITVADDDDDNQAYEFDLTSYSTVCAVDSAACTIDCGNLGGCSCDPHAGSGHWDCNCRFAGWSETTVDWDGCPWGPESDNPDFPVSDDEDPATLCLGSFCASCYTYDEGTEARCEVAVGGFGCAVECGRWGCEAGCST